MRLVSHASGTGYLSWYWTFVMTEFVEGRGDDGRQTNWANG
jgi:hypothetical protein